MNRKILTYILITAAVPAVIAAGAFLFDNRRYAFVSLAVALLACVPFFLAFERNGQKNGTQKMIVVAVMTALSVVGRIVFTPIPGFKPVTAIVVITAMYFGCEAGFMTGSLSALISNFYCGQGPWTPLQMFVWGFVGFLAGLLASPLRRRRIVLAVYAVFSGAVYSLLMDVWTVLWWDGAFNAARYLAAIVSSLPFTAVYAASNVVFMLLLAKPIGRKLERIKLRYGI